MSEQKNFWDTSAGKFLSWATPIGFVGNVVNSIGGLLDGNDQSSTTTAQQQLEQFQASRPGGYSSPYAGQISDLTGQLNDREFSYDYTQDPAYQYYKSLYQQQAQRAGEHAQASAAALGGGYGNSWATTAGSNAYNAQLGGLSDVISGLYDQALGEYNNETDRLQSNLNSLYTAESNAQNAYASQMNNYYNQLNYYQQQAEAEQQRKQAQNDTWWDIGGTLLNAAITLLPYVLALL